MEEKNLNTTTQENAETQEAPKDTLQTEQTNTASAETQEKKNEPTVQELMVELAKLKRAQEKAASEAADYKKKWQSSLSEKEQADMAKAEAQAKKDEEFESLKRQVRVNELTENFMDLGYGKEIARRAANAQADGDTATLLTIQKQFQESQKKAWETEFLKNRPEINAGTGNAPTVSKEDFDKMSLMERTKLKRENKAEYDRLIAL